MLNTNVTPWFPLRSPVIPWSPSPVHRLFQNALLTLVVVNLFIWELRYRPDSPESVLISALEGLTDRLIKDNILKSREIWYSIPVYEYKLGPCFNYMTSSPVYQWVSRCVSWLRSYTIHVLNSFQSIWLCHFAFPFYIISCNCDGTNI